MKAYMDYTTDSEDDLILEVDGVIVKEIKNFSKGHIEVNDQRIKPRTWHFWRVITGRAS